MSMQELSFELMLAILPTIRGGLGPRGCNAFLGRDEVEYGQLLACGLNFVHRGAFGDRQSLV